MIRTRFAPSPTGDLHIGGARTALFSWLFARHHNGQFILRIEDTDQERSTPEAIQKILAGLDWLGIDFDQGPYYQSQRTERYQFYLEKLLKEGHAYVCSCSTQRLEKLRQAQRERGEKPRYDGHCRYQSVQRLATTSVIRFKNPAQGTVTIEDRVFGRVVFSNTELDDFILARSDGTPTYNFTVVIDDYEMAMTHIIRGNDHLNNTPRQVNLLKALGAPIPIYMHIPMIQSDHHKKLSKRDGAASVMEYQAAGFLKEAMVNYLVRLGWSHGDQELFSREELIQYFDGSCLNKSPAILNHDKLLWLNQQYLKKIETSIVAEFLKPFTTDWHWDGYPIPALSDIVAAQRTRVKTLKEMADRSRFFWETPPVDPSSIDPNWLTVIQHMYSECQQLDEWTSTTISALLKQTMALFQLKPKELFQALRTLLVGATISPPIDITIELLGKQRVLSRLQVVCCKGP